MLNMLGTKHLQIHKKKDSTETDIHNLIRSGVKQYMPFNEFQCAFLEAKIEEIITLGETGSLKDLTIDRSPLRNKYFFGERYSYGSQMTCKGLGNEKLFPANAVDSIPTWVSRFVVRPLEMTGVITPNFVNSVVIVVYQPGGCIAPHVDPPQLFARPVVSVSLLSTSSLSFGSKFRYKPLRASDPIMSLALPRGAVTLLSGFAADGITHSVRPQDTMQRRAVILLRQVLADAPRMPSPVQVQSNLNDIFSSMMLNQAVNPETVIKNAINLNNIILSNQFNNSNNVDNFFYQINLALSLSNLNNSIIRYTRKSSNVLQPLSTTMTPIFNVVQKTGANNHTRNETKKCIPLTMELTKPLNECNETLYEAKDCFYENNIHFSLDKYLGAHKE